MNRKFASASKIPIPALKKCEEKQSSTLPKFTIFSETGVLLKDSKSSLKLLVWVWKKPENTTANRYTLAKSDARNLLFECNFLFIPAKIAIFY